MGYSVSYFLLPTILILIGLRKFRAYKWGRCANKTKLTKKVVIVTGANSGIGYEIAKDLASREAHIIFACRNVKAAEDAIAKIKRQLPEAALTPMQLDLASLKSVKDFADEIKLHYSEISLLINNAGVFYPDKIQKQTEDGFEIHFGTNHLGHFFLTNLLLDVIKRTKGSRIVIVASQLHERANFGLDDLNLERVSNIKGYSNSKLLNVYFGIELSKRLEGSGVNVYSLCPGFVYTNLFRSMELKWYKIMLFLPIAFLYMRSPQQGAQTAIFCATEPQLDNESGLMYRDCKKYKSKVTFDPIMSSKIWDLSDKLINKAVL